MSVNPNRLQVFSLTGEHRRSIVGEWKMPQFICFVKDRLYMIERACEVEVEADDEDRVTKLLQGRRIIVLSLLGEILQVVTHPTEGYRAYGCVPINLLLRQHTAGEIHVLKGKRRHSPEYVWDARAARPVRVRVL